MESIIRDIKLAKSGHEKISWVDRHMPAHEKRGPFVNSAKEMEESL